MSIIPQTKKLGGAILMLDKVNFRATKIQGNKGTLYSEKG